MRNQLNINNLKLIIEGSATWGARTPDLMIKSHLERLQSRIESFVLPKLISKVISHTPDFLEIFVSWTPGRSKKNVSLKC